MRRLYESIMNVDKNIKDANDGVEMMVKVDKQLQNILNILLPDKFIFTTTLFASTYRNGNKFLYSFTSKNDNFVKYYRNIFDELKEGIEAINSIVRVRTDKIKYNFHNKTDLSINIYNGEKKGPVASDKYINILVKGNGAMADSVDIEVGSYFKTSIENYLAAKRNVCSK